MYSYFNKKVFLITIVPLPNMATLSFQEILSTLERWPLVRV